MFLDIPQIRTGYRIIILKLCTYKGNRTTVACRVGNCQLVITKILYFQREQPRPSPHPGHSGERAGRRSGPRAAQRRRRHSVAGPLSAAQRTARLRLASQRRGLCGGRGDGPSQQLGSPTHAQASHRIETRGKNFFRYILCCVLKEHNEHSVWHR